MEPSRKEIKAHKIFRSAVQKMDNRLPGVDLSSTLLGFLDGSGDDTISEGDLDAWHTFAYFCAPAHRLLSNDFRDNPILPGRTLFKWSGVNPLYDEISLGCGDRDAYRLDFFNGLRNFTHKETALISAWSYRGRDLFLCCSGLLHQLGIPPLAVGMDRGYVQYHDSKWRNCIFIKNFSRGTDLDMPIGNFLVLAMAALQLVGVAKASSAMFEQHGGTIVVTDPLCGDPVIGKQKHGMALGSLLDALEPGRMNLRFSKLQDHHVGELLADNVAGMLQKHLMALDEGKTTFFDSSKLSRSIVFRWVALECDDRKQLRAVRIHRGEKPRPATGKAAGRS